MPSLSHEALVELFRRRPSLAGELLGHALLPPSPAHVLVADSNLTASAPVERTADIVLLFSRTVDGPPERVVIVEVQLAIDPAKRRSWWWYLANAHTRHACDAFLVIVTPSAPVAEWAARPIGLGQPGTVLRPLVIGPAQVPVVTNPAEAIEAPELAVLSAVVHGQGDHADDIARAAFEAVRRLDGEQLAVYTDVVIASLRASARIILEGLMANGTYEYQSDFAKKFVAQGQAEGEARGEARGKALAVIGVLEARGLPVPPDVRARIEGCIDVGTLDLWIARAVTAAAAAEVVADS
jgi:hypothetical protein